MSEHNVGDILINKKTYVRVEVAMVENKFYHMKLLDDMSNIFKKNDHYPEPKSTIDDEFYTLSEWRNKKLERILG